MSTYQWIYWKKYYVLQGEHNSFIPTIVGRNSTTKYELCGLFIVVRLAVKNAKLRGINFKPR